MNKKTQPFYILLLLIIAGEAVFILPFVLARVFRPTVLEVFELNNFQLGVCFSVYGGVALLSYLFGGPLADKFHPRKLMGFALLATALGGLYLATYPGYNALKVLYGYWGFTTIFLFWAPLIKATRMWGGQENQGRAFGFLDGGRGLVAASFGLLGVVVFSLFLKTDINAATLLEKRTAFRQVILCTAAVMVIIAILTFFLLKPKAKQPVKIFTPDRSALSDFRKVIKIPSVWLLMVIIVCAYTGYKSTDVFSLYAKDVMLFDEINAAKVGTFMLYLRPVTGVIIGLLADRTKGALLLVWGFVIMVLGSAIFASGALGPQAVAFFALSLFFIALGVYATRVLYFAVLREGKIPLALTGTAVGVISVIGYTPEIFAGPAMGYLLDASPGELGHQHVFWMLGGFSFIGFLAALKFYRLTVR